MWTVRNCLLPAACPCTSHGVCIDVAVAVSSGVTAAAASAPFIAIVDAAITSNASGRMPLWAAVKEGFRELATAPQRFVRKPSFLWITLVYSGTYVVANTVQLACRMRDTDPALPKFASTSAANIGLSMLKDRAFAKMYAKPGMPVPGSFPAASLGLFAVRDSLTVMASFTLPPKLTPAVEQATGLSHTVARGAVQLVTPCAVQVLSVPLHLHALDLYNRPSATDRVAFICREYGKTVLARWGRIFPAFGVGGVINLQMQDLLNSQLGRPQ